MKIRKKIKLLLMAVLIIFIFVGCEIEGGDMSEFKTYSNI